MDFIYKLWKWFWYAVLAAFLFWPALAIVAVFIGIILLLLAIVFVIGLALLPFALVWYLAK